MDTPPTYQEATGRKSAWLSRIIGRLFRRTPPAPTVSVERKLIAPLYSDDEKKSSSSKPTRNPYSRPTSLQLPGSSKHASAAYRNSVIHTPDQPPTNYVRIKRSNAPITGIWNIDTSLYIPSHLLVQFKDKSEARHHLHLWSVKQNINAIVNVVGGERKDVALITCSTLGKVNLQLDKPFNRLISVFCRGNIISVKIPRTYNGIVKAHTLSGSVHFSNEVAKRLSTIYEKENESRHFIGEMSPSDAGSSDVRAQIIQEEVRDAEGKDEDAADNTVNVEEAPAAKDAKEEEEKQLEKKYDVLKLKAKTRVGTTYGEVFIAYSDEPEMPLRALYFH